MNFLTAHEYTEPPPDYSTYDLFKQAVGGGGLHYREFEKIAAIKHGIRHWIPQMYSLVTKTLEKLVWEQFSTRIRIEIDLGVTNENRNNDLVVFDLRFTIKDAENSCSYTTIFVKDLWDSVYTIPLPTKDNPLPKPEDLLIGIAKEQDALLLVLQEKTGLELSPR